MMKLRSILKSRVSISGKISSANGTTLEVFGLNALMNRAYGQNAASNDRIYAPYSIYKGKGAFSVYPVAPKFGEVNSGGLRVKRQGYIMLTFSSSVGERKYDWERKQLFALSATEVGTLINLGPNGSCEFFHDPAMQTSNAGQVQKTLSVKANSEHTGYFISLTVANKVTKTNQRITVPVTSAEFSVMRTSFNFALPHIMGWDRYSSQMPKIDDNSVNKRPQSLDSEWDR